MTEYINCAMRGDILTPCKGLEKMVRGYGDQIGVNMIEYSNLDTDKQTFKAATYRMDRKRENPNMIMHFCPCCGIDIRPARVKK